MAQPGGAAGQYPGRDRKRELLPGRAKERPDGHRRAQQRAFKAGLLPALLDREGRLAAGAASPCLPALPGGASYHPPAALAAGRESVPALDEPGPRAAGRAPAVEIRPSPAGPSLGSGLPAAVAAATKSFGASTCDRRSRSREEPALAVRGRTGAKPPVETSTG